jgi:hypothetical protein
LEQSIYRLRANRGRKPRGRFGALGLIAYLLVFYALVVLLGPWAFHMGDRWTPLLYWTGKGKLVTKSGTYPLIVTLFPSSHFSRFRFDDLRRTGGIQGNGLLCTSQGVTQYITLSGTEVLAVSTQTVGYDTNHDHKSDRYASVPCLSC